MLNCKYCFKKLKNNNSLIQHEIRCLKNEERIIVKSNFIEYNNKIRNKSIEKSFSNQYTKAKKLGLDKPIVSEETRNKLREKISGKKWTEAQKIKHSERMKIAVINNPQSYSINNVSGRVKTLEYKGIKLKGKWELLFAIWMDNNNYKWTNDIEPFVYIWEGSEHLYFPDFYLTEYDFYVEVKGYERERDRKKWDVVKNLIVIKKNEIEKIKNGTYRLSLITS